MATESFVCDASSDASNCSSTMIFPEPSLHQSCSMSSFDIIYVAACSSFLTIVCAALFNFLKINIKSNPSRWLPPPIPDFDTLVRSTKQSYIAQAQQLQQSQRTGQSVPHHGQFPPKNKYFNVVDRAFKTFLESIQGTERDGWQYQGEKRGLKKYKKDIHGSPFSIFRGEKILHFPQHVLFNAVRHDPMRYVISDGRLKDTGPLEVVDENCSVRFEAYKSPAPFVDARDFVYIDTIHRFSDGTIVSFNKSITHSSRPESSKFTRGDIKVAGWAFHPIPNEPNKTKVVFLARTDPGGSFPGWLVNQLASDIPMTVERLDMALQRTPDLSIYDKPLPDVLLFGPRNTGNHSMDQSVNTNSTELVMGNGVNHHQHVLNGNNNSLSHSIDSGNEGAFRYPQLSEEQKQRFEQILRENDGDFFASKEYLDLIPDDPEWIRRVPVLVNGTEEEHKKLLDRFIVPDDAFQYKTDIESAIALFQEWRSWKDGQEWTFKTQKENLKIWTRSIPNEAVDVVKGEAVVPFPTTVVAGTLLNPNHRKKWDFKLDEVRRVEKSSEFSSIIYISVKTPTFITYRDMVAIAFVYPFPDGSLIIGSRSIIHPKFPPKKTRVRANINCDIWHIRPHFGYNTTHSKVTHYSHMSLGGSLPNWVINQVVVDIPSGILKVRDYIKRIYPTIHRKGQLNCPLNLLKIMGIDLGWMDPDPLNQWGIHHDHHHHDESSVSSPNNGNSISNVMNSEIDDVESKEISGSNDFQTDTITSEFEERMNHRNTMPHHHQLQQQQQSVQRLNGNKETPSPPKRAQSAYKSPSIHFLSAPRQNTWSGRDASNGSNGSNGHYVPSPNGSGEAKSGNSGSMSSSSSRKRNRMPNQTLTMQNAMSSDSKSDHSNRSIGGSPKGIIRVTREQWENGMTLRLSEIKNITLQRSMSTILSHKKARTRLSSANEEELEQSTNAMNGNQAMHQMQRTQSEPDVVQNNNNNNNNSCNTEDALNGHKYALSSTLSVRDAASYMTLANCAVSELLQQTDPSSKNYWIPSEAKTPRGIFVYKFIHSRERYYHYMGKAILHHEPKFIFDALTDPSFRFQYDQMLLEMQVLDKLDESTYIARYVHENQQCYIKQKRETIAVIRHRCVCENDKYVAAGTSIEHKLYPTENGVESLKQREGAQQSDASDIGHLSEQLSGKGPSKSVNNGMLRIDIKASGWVIERNMKKPTDSIVSYITDINFGGSIPSAILKTIAKKQPLAIFYLGKALKQRAKELKSLRKQKRARQMQMQKRDVVMCDSYD